MSRVPTTTVGGYPGSQARVLQAPSFSNRAPTTIGSTGVVGSRVVGATPGAIQTKTLGTGTIGQPVTSVPTTAQRQARVITPGATSAVAATAPRTIVSSAAPQATRTVVAGATTTAPRVVTGTVGARPAKVISGPTAQPNTIGGPAYTQAAYEVKHKDDPQLQNLKELRKTCGLKNIPVNDALQSLKSMSSDGKLTREQFLAAYTLLLQNFQVEVPTDDVKNAVFDLFDRDDNGIVDMMELICGASLLCTGTEEDKIHAVFNVFDENGDGVISMDEMFKFLTSVFKVVLTPNVMAVMNSMGVTVESPEDLASVTALECFKTADLNHDGRLSVAEFKNWFFAPRNDPSFLFSPVRKLLQ